MERSGRHPTVGLHGPHEIEILHQRHPRYPAHALEHAATKEEGLISIGECEEGHAERHPPFDEAQRGASPVEAQAEGAGHDARPPQTFPERKVPTPFEAGVGVEE